MSSDTALSHAIHLETAARLARAVAARFPTATLEVLWDNGSRVFVAEEIEPTHVQAVVVQGDVRLLRYVEVTDGEDTARVFERRAWFHGAYATVVLKKLREKAPEAYAALVREASP